MSEAPPTDVRTDGRVARRERNRDAVIDAVLEMLAEEMLFPTIEQASKRSGLSLRSVYRYFADPGELIEATIKRNREIADPLAHLPSIGEGTQEHRIDDFVKMRLRLYEGVGPVYRATVHNAPSMARIRDELADTRQDLRRQFDQQFASELDLLGGAAREAIGGAGDVLTQLDSIDLLRRHRQLTVAETDGVLRTGLTALFAPRP